MSDEQPKQQTGARWEFDKRIPVALIIAIATQAAGVVWVLAKQDARLTALEKVDPFTINTRVALVEQKLTTVSADTERTAQVVDRLERKWDNWMDRTQQSKK